MDTLVLLVLCMIIASSGCMRMSWLEKPTAVSPTPPSGMSLKGPCDCVEKGKIQFNGYVI